MSEMGKAEYRINFEDPDPDLWMPQDLVKLEMDREYINLLAGSDYGIDLIAVRHGYSDGRGSYIIGVEISRDGDTRLVFWSFYQLSYAPRNLWKLQLIQRAKEHLDKLSR